MNIQWFSDSTAEIAHKRLKDALEEVVKELFPNYELSHSGFNRNYDTEEVKIVLHLNRVGKIKVRDDQANLLALKSNI